jgi:signal peptide peptidase SppA
MQINIFRQIFNKPWLIEESEADKYLLLVAKFLNGEEMNFSHEVEDYAFAVNAAGVRIGNVADAKDEGVAVINMRGAVMKYDYCGAPGSQSIASMIDAANANPSIKAIVLQIDSPGGAVDGTETLANTVKNSKKPVVAFANGMMASAAYWIGSAASHVIASSTTDLIGSIGTMATLVDSSEYKAQMGIKEKTVYASASTEKNADFREALAGNEEPLKKNLLDPANESFHKAVQSNRANVDASVFGGAAYRAKAAKSKGLIDGIGTFKQALNKALQLSKESATIQQQKINQMKDFKNILTAAQVAAVYEEGNFFGLNEDQMFAVEQKLMADADALTAAQTMEGTLSAAVTTMQDALNTANENFALASAEIEKLQNEIAELKKADGTAGAHVPKENDATPATVGETSIDKWWASAKK